MNFYDLVIKTLGKAPGDEGFETICQRLGQKPNIKHGLNRQTYQFQCLVLESSNGTFGKAVFQFPEAGLLLNCASPACTDLPPPILLNDNLKSVKEKMRSGAISSAPIWSELFHRRIHLEIKFDNTAQSLKSIDLSQMPLAKPWKVLISLPHSNFLAAVLKDAANESRDRRQNCIGPESIFISLLKDDEIRTTAAINKSTLTTQIARDMVCQLSTPESDTTMAELKQNERADSVIRLAETKAQIEESKYVEPRHVMLALLDSDIVVIHKILEMTGVDKRELREDLSLKI